MMVRALAAGLLLLTATPASGEPAKSAASRIDGVALVVDDRMVLASELRTRARFMRYEEQRVNPDRKTSDAELFRHFVDEMVEQELVASECDRLHLSVTPEEIEAALKTIAGNAGISVAEVVKKVEELGNKEADYREELGRQMLTARLMQVKLAGALAATGKLEEADRYRALEAERKRMIEGLKKDSPTEIRASQADLFTGAPASGSVAKVELRGSARKGPSDRLKTVAKAPLNAQQVASDLRMLWSTGGYEDVQAVQETGAGGAVVAFVLTDRPTIHAVKIEGCQALEVAEARAMFPADGEPFKVAAVAQSVSRLREALVNLGSMQAKVTYEVKKLPERKVDVRVQVVEGTKAVIKSIRFDGLWVAKKADLIGLMDTDEARCNTAGKPYDRDHFARSKLLWTDWYYNHGAVAVRIEDEQLDLVDDGKGVEILVRVKEGPVFRVGSVDLTGDLKVPKTDLVKAVGLTKGEVFSRERIRAAVQRVSALQKEKGGKENVVPLSRVDSEKSVVDLTFEISD